MRRIGDGWFVSEPEDPDEIIESIGRRIAEIRRERGMTQRQLADDLGVAVPWISKVETKGSNLEIKTVLRIAAALGVRGRDLWESPLDGRPGGKRLDRGRPKKTS